MAELGMQNVECEHVFHQTRRWRLDYFWRGNRGGLAIGIEIEGGVYTRGRHTRGRGFEEDLVKYNEATMRGIRVLRFSSGQVLRGEAREFLRQWL